MAAPPDPVHVDDVLLKSGSLPYTLEELAGSVPRERWSLGEEWPPAGPDAFTAETRVARPLIDREAEDVWRVHYERGRPLAAYCNRQIAVALTRGAEYDPALGFSGTYPLPRVEQVSPDIVWAEIGGRVVVERGEYPRFETPAGPTLFNEPLVLLRDNLYRVGTSGFVVAASRHVTVRANRVECPHPTWWMVAREEDAERVSRRVFTLKIYDGPYRYGARGTDITIADPVPLPSEADYAFYSYDEQGLRGLYRERHRGISPHKRAITITARDLLDRATQTKGELSFDRGRVAGVGTLSFDLPVDATKLLSLYWRGDEVDVRLSVDGGPFTPFSDYDGLAATQVRLEVSVFNSLSSVRLEYEGLEDWSAHGRPRVDLVPAGWGGTVVRLTGRSGEGLVQRAGLATGDYTASVNVRCHRGRTIAACGGIELVSWNPLDKSIRAGGHFVVERGVYEMVLTGEALNPNETFSCDLDRFRVAPGTDASWIEEDVAFELETEGERVPISGSVNLPNTPVGAGGRRFRLAVTAPEDLGEAEHVTLSRVTAELYSTGSRTYERTVRYRSTSPSRLHYPAGLVQRPQGSYYEVSGTGKLRWSLFEDTSQTDVALTVEGSPLAYRTDETDAFEEGYFYLPAHLDNSVWSVEVFEGEARVWREGELAGSVSGGGLPFRVAAESAEDIRLECPAGIVQLRRGLGPRFEGFDLDYAQVPAFTAPGGVVAFGASEEEARENLPFLTVEVRG